MNLTLSARRSSSRHTRREFLSAGVAGALGLAFSPLMQRSLAGQTGPRAASCILVWLGGGPSHIDTFDPKPGAETGGPFKAIQSTVPGMRLSEHFPRLAGLGKHLAVVRSMTSREADHDRATYYLHTGSVPTEAVEMPELGSVVARTSGGGANDLPPFVAIDGQNGSPGFLGVEFASHAIGSGLGDTLPNVALPGGVDDARLEKRLKALEAMNRRHRAGGDPLVSAEHDRFTARAARFRRSPALKAFDLKAEDPKVLAAYGAEADDAGFNRGCLLARRLIEQGVRFVEVSLGGWDTHSDNFNQVKDLSARLDRGLSSLLTDLDERGRLNDTLVVCMGEFGRTPQINGDRGRDHYSDVFSVLLAGGGIRGGQVIGASDDQGAKVKDRPITVPDLFTTLLSLSGVTPGKQFRTAEGRPIKLAEHGSVVTELLR